MTRHVYGPVPSRRLGRSLGVDLVAPKTCPYDCIYCQLGRTTHHTSQRRAYVPTDALLADVRELLDAGAEPDYLTVCGSGEPTLHSDLGRIIRALNDTGAAPVAVLTNGALLQVPAVRKACAEADVVLPTLSTTRGGLFQRIHRPCKGITLDHVLAGMKTFRDIFAGQIWLEVMLLDGINADDESVEDLQQALNTLEPDRVQLNTAVRPPAETFVRPVPPAKMVRIRDALGPNVEIVAEYEGPAPEAPHSPDAEAVVELLRRRPCTAEDVAAGLATQQAAAVKLLALLERDGRVRRESRPNGVFFRANQDRLTESPDESQDISR